jgi:hypothetical protein
MLTKTLNEFAVACEERHEGGGQIDRYRERLRVRFIDLDRPWMRRSIARVESKDNLSRDDPEAPAADFNARQLNLFRPQAEWDNEF